MSAERGTIRFPGGTRARVVEAGRRDSGEEMLLRLGLPAPKGTVVVNGSTSDLPPAHGARVEDALVNGVARVAVAEGLTVVTGATDVGVFSILGPALARSSAPLVGVAPAALVTWPGRDGADEAGQAALEANHSHFVLVDGDEWGDETAAMLALAAALGQAAPTAAVLCGGGVIARNEAVGHSRAGRPVVVVAGSGRLADELAQAVATGGVGHDPDLAELAAAGHLVICPPEQDGHAVGNALLAVLRAPPAGR